MGKKFPRRSVGRRWASSARVERAGEGSDSKSDRVLDCRVWALGADDDAEGGVSTARRVRSDGGMVGINRARERRRETNGDSARARRGTLRSQVAEAELAKELVTTRSRTRVKNSSK